MWANVLTKPLQGAQFRLMRAFLMNCPIDYSEDPDITPTSNPTLSATTSSPSLRKHNPSFVPTNEPTDIPMKKRSLRPTPSSRGCVETKSHGTDVPSSRAYEYAQKKVTWKDPLFPRRKPSSSSSPRTAKKRASAHKLINISISNVKSAM